MPIYFDLNAKKNLKSMFEKESSQFIVFTK